MSISGYLALIGRLIVLQTIKKTIWRYLGLNPGLSLTRAIWPNDPQNRAPVQSLCPSAVAPSFINDFTVKFFRKFQIYET